MDGVDVGPPAGMQSSRTGVVRRRDDSGDPRLPGDDAGGGMAVDAEREGPDPPTGTPQASPLGGVQEDSSNPSLPPGDGTGGGGGGMAVDPPTGAPQRQPGGPPPPSPTQQAARRARGKRAGQPRRPMQTLYDDHRAPACKSCKGHRGVRHCCSHHHAGHPRLAGGGGGQQRLPAHCLPVHGGLQLQLGVRASGGSVVREPPPSSEGPGESPAGLGPAAPAPGDTSGHGRASEEGT